MTSILINIHVNKLCDIVLDSNSTFSGTIKVKPVIVDSETFIEYILKVDNEKFIVYVYQSTLLCGT